MQVLSLCWEDPLEEGIATHSNIFAWRIPWTEEPGQGPCRVGTGESGLVLSEEGNPAGLSHKAVKRESEVWWGQKTLLFYINWSENV